MTAIALQQRDTVINALADGKRLSDIAPSLGVSPNAISKVLKKDPEYREAIESGLDCRLDESEAAIEQAIEQVDVARARARFQSVAWRAEREVPERWGARQQIDLRAVSINIVRYVAEPVAPMPKDASTAHNGCYDKCADETVIAIADMSKVTR